uniref:Glycosyltransferase n=1 Tax=Tetraselmis sp. GSL018 TaxID=582737 RepID=A0A061QQR3_9CHLO|eukprot:CAMPEP_0177622130 /NCGR_PEP_ID=MMETSP0419_2-20121207/28047_1 /TAXON_ID=582737 /ORGANISM="Tetraselmis sp., Strain GSL018" /LENGTH=613 /DNA_ID=CAMNT_0019122279 /DNA_START=741 /DNA_END=2582 /DNA_ORIENTATION=+
MSSSHALPRMMCPLETPTNGGERCACRRLPRLRPVPPPGLSFSSLYPKDDTERGEADRAAAASPSPPKSSRVSVARWPSARPSIGTALTPSQPAVASPPKLTEGLARSIARDNIIIVTWANDHFSDFVFNWVHHIQKHGIANYLVGAMDRKIGARLAQAGIQAFAMYEEGTGAVAGLHTGAFVWGGRHFHMMGREKVRLAKTFTGFGLDLMLCDVDVVWVKDPTKYFAAIPQADVLTSSDELHSTIPAGDTGLEEPEAAHAAMNIGLMFFRHSEHTKALVDAWNARLEADAKLWDQEAFNSLVREGFVPFKRHPDNSRVFAGFRQTVWVGILPVAAFASGHTFFVQDLHKVQRVDPFVVHTTFQYGGPAGKRTRLRERGLWADPPGYFQGRFISADLASPATPPGWDSMNTDQRIDFHKQSMARQLKELRELLQLAVALDRIVVMPRLICFCDRYWAPVEGCRIPGAFATALPFTCPLDHILEPFHMDDDPLLFGTPLRFREYSFLERKPPSMAYQEATLVFGDGGLAQIPSNPENRTKVKLPTNYSERILRRQLEPFSKTEFLWIEGLSKVRGSLVNQDGFEKRVGHLAGIWCCQGKKGGYSYAPMLLHAAK